MTKLKYRDKIDVEFRAITGHKEKYFEFLNTRLVISKKSIKHNQEINSIISELEKRNFYFITDESTETDIILIFENPDNVVKFDTISGFGTAYDKNAKFLLECMDSIITYPYKLILEVFARYS